MYETATPGDAFPRLHRASEFKLHSTASPPNPRRLRPLRLLRRKVRAFSAHSTVQPCRFPAGPEMPERPNKAEALKNFAPLPRWNDPAHALAGDSLTLWKSGALVNHTLVPWNSGAWWLTPRCLGIANGHDGLLADSLVRHSSTPWQIRRAVRRAGLYAARHFTSHAIPFCHSHGHAPFVHETYVTCSPISCQKLTRFLNKKTTT